MTTRPPERDDLDALLDALVRFAQEMLKERGTFFPFGAVMTVTGEVALRAAHTGSEHPPSGELLETLRTGMREQAVNGLIRAAGLCYDGTVRGEGGTAGEAIAVDLEHRAGDVVAVLMPYSKPRFGAMRFGELTAATGDPHIFN